MPPQFLHCPYALHELHFLRRRYLATLKDAKLVRPRACLHRTKAGRRLVCSRR